MIIDPYTWRKVPITDIVRESPRAVSLRVDAGRYDFHPGQYAIVRVSLPNGIQLIRQYSFASAPATREVWFTIVETSGGEVSTWCNRRARVGDMIEITDPLSGGFGKRIDAKRVCMLAGGSGIVPLMSYLRQNRRRPMFDAVTLLYSTRTDAECFHRELSVGTETIIVRRTDVQPRFSTHDIAPYCRGSDAVLLCGSRNYVEAMRTLCAPFIDDSRILSESFSLV